MQEKIFKGFEIFKVCSKVSKNIHGKGVDLFPANVYEMQGLTKYNIFIMRNMDYKRPKCMCLRYNN